MPADVASMMALHSTYTLQGWAHLAKSVRDGNQGELRGGDCGIGRSPRDEPDDGASDASHCQDEKDDALQEDGSQGLAVRQLRHRRSMWSYAVIGAQHIQPIRA